MRRKRTIVGITPVRRFVLLQANPSAALVLDIRRMKHDSDWMGVDLSLHVGWAIMQYGGIVSAGEGGIGAAECEFLSGTACVIAGASALDADDMLRIAAPLTGRGSKTRLAAMWRAMGEKMDAWTQAYPVVAVCRHCRGSGVASDGNESRT